MRTCRRRPEARGEGRVSQPDPHNAVSMRADSPCARSATCGPCDGAATATVRRGAPKDKCRLPSASAAWPPRRRGPPTCASTFSHAIPASARSPGLQKLASRHSPPACGGCAALTRHCGACASPPYLACSLALSTLAARLCNDYGLPRLTRHNGCVLHASLAPPLAFAPIEVHSSIVAALTPPSRSEPLYSPSFDRIPWIASSIAASLD